MSVISIMLMLFVISVVVMHLTPIYPARAQVQKHYYKHSCPQHLLFHNFTFSFFTKKEYTLLQLWARFKCYAHNCGRVHAYGHIAGKHVPVRGRPSMS